MLDYMWERGWDKELRAFYIAGSLQKAGAGILEGHEILVAA